MTSSTPSAATVEAKFYVNGTKFKSGMKKRGKILMKKLSGFDKNGMFRRHIVISSSNLDGNKVRRSPNLQLYSMFCTAKREDDDSGFSPTPKRKSKVKGITKRGYRYQAAKSDNPYPELNNVLKKDGLPAEYWPMHEKFEIIEPDEVELVFANESSNDQVVFPSRDIMVPFDQTWRCGPATPATPRTNDPGSPAPLDMLDENIELFEVESAEMKDQGSDIEFCTRQLSKTNISQIGDDDLEKKSLNRLHYKGTVIKPRILPLHVAHREGTSIRKPEDMENKSSSKGVNFQGKITKPLNSAKSSRKTCNRKLKNTKKKSNKRNENDDLLMDKAGEEDVIVVRPLEGETIASRLRRRSPGSKFVSCSTCHAISFDDIKAIARTKAKRVQLGGGNSDAQLELEAFIRKVIAMIIEDKGNSEDIITVDDVNKAVQCLAKAPKRIPNDSQFLLRDLKSEVDRKIWKNVAKSFGASRVLNTSLDEAQIGFRDFLFDIVGKLTEVQEEEINEETVKNILKKST